MKKILSLLVLMLTIILIAGCDNSKNSLENEVKIITPYDTPHLALGGLLEEVNINIEAVNGADNLKTALTTNSHDIVIAPINLGVMLFNGGKSDYKVAAILTMNNTHIVTNKDNKLTSFNDLKNEKVIAFGQNGIPGSILKKLYSDYEFDINNVDFTFGSSSAVYSVFSKGSTDAKYALISELQISKLVLIDKLEIKTLDLCKELGVDVPQACIFINPNSKKLDDVNKVLEMIEINVNWLNNNPEEYASKVITLDRIFGETTKEVIARGIPLANIVYKKGRDYQNEINNILNILGVKKPDDSFYY